MLTSADEYPIHQTPEPIAYAGTDRNFYDRYFFNGFNPNGSEFFGVSFGVYPQLGIADAHFSVVRGGVQHCLHASRWLIDRLDLTVGPVTIEIVEPLQTLRVTVRQAHGIAADIVFAGRAAPHTEPRFTHRFGTRNFMDITRLTQNVRVSGWIEIDGARCDLAAGALGTRDRSWGVRGIGQSDPQPLAPPVTPGIFWIWTPLHFADTSYFFHVMAEPDGTPWNLRAAIAADGAAQHEIAVFHGPHIDLTLKPGLRHCASGLIRIPSPDGAIELHLQPAGRFQMKGIGYAHPTWAHGLNHGELKIEREDFILAELDGLAPENIHVQDFAHATLRRHGAPDEHGIGTFEQAIFGPYGPLNLGLTGAATPGESC